MIGAALLLGSCGTYTGDGALAGGTIGAVLGSSIGGIAGGWRGHDIGTVVGLASGAVVGAAVGAAAEQQEKEAYARYQNDRTYRSGAASQRDYGGDSGYSASGGGDDRIDFNAPGPRGSQPGYSASAPRSYTPTPSTVGPGYRVRTNDKIEIRNARIIDADHDHVLRSGEECQITFEIMNHSEQTIYDVQPTVFDTTGNKHIHISPNLHVESIAPHSGVRYTASIRADHRLKDGTAVIRVAVAQGNREITSQVQEFALETRRR